MSEWQNISQWRLDDVIAPKLDLDSEAQFLSEALLKNIDYPSKPFILRPI